MSVQIDNLRRALGLSVVAVLTVLDAPVAGSTERPSSSEENADRFVLNDGAFAISRPDESWRFEVDASDPPVVARMHSAGDEVVVLLEGVADFVLDLDGGEQVVPLSEPGAFVVVPRGVWHTARVRAPSRALFLTRGDGTEHRPA